MTRRSYRPILAGCACILGLVLVSHAQVSAPQADDVLHSEMKYIKAEAAKAKLLPRATKKLRAALVVAAAAAHAAADNKESPLAGVATKALEAAKALDKDPAAAKKIIAEMDAKHPAAKLPALKYHDALELKLVMNIFSNEKIGGFGLEKAITDDLVDHKGAFDADALKTIAVLAAKTALIGDIILDYPPTEESGMKTKKNWVAFSHDMSKVATELASAAKSKSGDIGKIADKLGKTCAACHDVFR
ncbi:MAG: hypothetical protein U0793_16600 [Gemmataceae bacterium]